MNLRDELAEEEAWVSEPGTPTVTFDNGDRKLMLPWHSFRHATHDQGGILLFFQGWRIELKGESLESLWREFQTQAIRSITLTEFEPNRSGEVSALSFEQI